jgi:RNA polymerase sigma-54 factor
MMDMSLDMVPEQTLRVSPTLIAVNQILALSSQELQAAIRQEAEDNPALEIVEHQTCSICGDVLKHGVCTSCSRSILRSEAPANRADDMGYTSLADLDYGGPSNLSFSSADEDFDPVALVAAEQTMRERLTNDLRSALPQSDHAIADYLVGSLDDRGFLMSDLDTLASELRIQPERVEGVLRCLQRLGTPGIGARNHQECLLLQLDYLEQETGEEPPHVRRILSDFYVELGEHKFALIAQKLSITAEQVEAARNYIRTHLTPYPVLSMEDEVSSWGSPSKAQYIAPDVIIREVEGELEVEVVESRRFFMKLNPMYSQMASEFRSKAAHYSEEDKRHVSQYVSRARMFMSNINQRRETMKKIAQALVEYQRDYLRQGVRHLKPLTRAQVAEATGLHESTVSRATAGKYVMLPSRQVVPFSDFFTASLSVKDVIKEIVVREGKPMTDREIVSRLRDQGIRVARRTVAKYRSQLGILPSKLR